MRVFAMSLLAMAVSGSTLPVPYMRVPPAERTFNSSSIDALIATLQPLLERGPGGSDLANLFANGLPNPLDTTVAIADLALGGRDCFIITGDIDAMWLRDSTNQVMPYLPYARDDSDLAALLCGVVRRQARSVLLDPYANAFNPNASGTSAALQASDRAMIDRVPLSRSFRCRSPPLLPLICSQMPAERGCSTLSCASQVLWTQMRPAERANLSSACFFPRRADRPTRFEYNLQSSQPLAARVVDWSASCARARSTRTTSARRR